MNRKIIFCLLYLDVYRWLFHGNFCNFCLLFTSVSLTFDSGKVRDKRSILLSVRPDE